MYDCIERQEAIKFIDSCLLREEKLQSVEKETLLAVKQRIEAIPPADVRTVVRWQWKDKKFGPWGLVYATCPACENRVTLGQRHTNFCPNCGADMMGGDADGSIHREASGD